MELLIGSFLHTAEWRREKAEEFPDDDRNIAAAELLEQLATGAGDLRGTDLEQRYFKVLERADGHPDVHLLCEAESEALRSVGFHSWPANATEFVDDLVTKLDDLCSEDAEA